MTTSQTPEEPMAVFEAMVRNVLADVKQRVPAASRHYVLTDDALEQVMVVAQSYGDQRVLEFVGWLDAAIHTEIEAVDTPHGKHKTTAKFKNELSAWIAEQAKDMLALPTGNAGKTEDSE